MKKTKYQQHFLCFVCISILVQLLVEYGYYSHKSQRCGVYQRHLFQCQYPNVQHLLDGDTYLRPGVYWRKYSNLLYETKVIGVTKLLFHMSKLAFFLWITVNVSRRNSTKVAQARICNTLLTSVLCYCITFSFCFNFRKLVLSSNKALYLLKQLLVGTLQKQLFCRVLFFTKPAALHLF